MSNFNNYSGYSQLFRNGMIGLLLSSGVFGTLLPNLVESIGYANDLASFRALNAFSVVYFLFPIVLCTSYWLMRGYRLYLMEKVLIKGTVEKAGDPFLQWRWAMMLAKAIPGLLFFVYPSLLGKTEGALLMMPFFLGVVLLQTRVVQKSGEYQLEWLFQNGVVDETKKRFLKNSLMRMSILIFSLDFLIGLVLIIFSQPWIIYSNYVYSGFVISILLYIIIFKAYVFRFMDTKDLRVDVATIAVTISLAALLFPTVNLYGIKVMPAVVAIVAIGGMLSVRMFTKEKHLLGFSPVNLVYFITCLILFYSFIPSLYYRSNVVYLKNRMEAAGQFSTHELFPFSLYRFLPDADKKTPKEKASIVNRIQDLNFSALYKRDEFSTVMNRTPSPKLLDEYNVRRLYYYQYDSLLNILDRAKASADTLGMMFPSQEILNGFYNDLNLYIERSIYPRYFDPAEEDHLEKFNPQFHHYFHPLDYAELHFEFCSTLKEESEKHLSAAKQLLTMQQSAVKGGITFPRTRTDSVLLREVNKPIYSDKPLQHMFDSLQLAECDSAHLQRLVTIHTFFNSEINAQYSLCYAATQKVFRSYLVDSQRIGVYIFLMAVLILCLAGYYNFKDNQVWEEPETRDTPWDSPAKLLFIQVVAITLLLIPLARPIQPENIDPEKPYWMISLANWHVPTNITDLMGEKNSDSEGTKSDKP